MTSVRDSSGADNQQAGAAPVASPALDAGAGPAPIASLKDGDLSKAIPLDEFMSQLGVLLRLPTRVTRAVPVVSAMAPARSRPILPVVATLCVLAYAAWALRPVQLAPVPAELKGTWETADARYAGRQLVIDDYSITNVSGVAAAETEYTLDVKATRVRDTLSVELSYGEPGAVGQLSLAYVRTPREHLVLRNPAGVVWQRSSGRTR